MPFFSLPVPKYMNAPFPNCEDMKKKKKKQFLKHLPENNDVELSKLTAFQDDNLNTVQLIK